MTGAELRQAVCEFAATQEGVVGASSYWPEVLSPDWQGPYPRHWCGGFALYCLHRVLGCTWPWDIEGITNNLHRSGFVWRLPRTLDPQPGDICYQALPYQHHAILLARGIEADGTRSTITQDGNQGFAPGECLRVYRPRPAWTSYYSIAPLLEAA